MKIPQTAMIWYYDSAGSSCSAVAIWDNFRVQPRYTHAKNAHRPRKNYYAYAMFGADKY